MKEAEKQWPTDTVPIGDLEADSMVSLQSRAQKWLSKSHFTSLVLTRVKEIIFSSLFGKQPFTSATLLQDKLKEDMEA